jgi:hypothetical protein
MGVMIDPDLKAVAEFMQRTVPADSSWGWQTSLRRLRAYFGATTPREMSLRCNWCGRLRRIVVREHNHSPPDSALLLRVSVVVLRR